MLGSSIAILLLGPLAALADAAPAPVTPAPLTITVSEQPGQPLIATFSDGREATFKVSTVDSPWTKATFKVTDNNCTNRQNMMCTYNFNVRRKFAGFVWTKNPDASRIGEIVEQSYPGSSGTPTKFETNFLLFSGLQSARFPLLAQGLKSHEMQCGDFSWLPSAQKTAPASLHVSRWDGEAAVINPETGLSENRTIGGVMGIDLVRTAPDTLQVSKVGPAVGTFGDLALTLQQAVSMTFNKGAGEICQAGISSNLLNEFLATFNGLEKQRKAPKDEVPYITGSDELLKDSIMKSQLQYWELTFSNSAGSVFK